MKSVGYIEVILGPMFSGKTSYLLNQIVKTGIHSSKVFKPVIDNRYSADHLVSHSKEKVAAINVSTGEDILRKISGVDKDIFIDEIQFFDISIVKVCEKLRNSGHHVRLAGLDKDSAQEFFDTSKELLGVADKIHLLKGKCASCGDLGEHTFCLNTSKKNKIAVGGDEMYECRCDNCI